MIYRFSDSGDGQVVAESKNDDLEPYLGLWYPASDIPEQARRMYVLNPIRSIPDARYSPVPLVPVINPDSQRPIDLSYSTLRSVSPIHCEYLTNMGVAASTSGSIVRDGRLWGLIACHHMSPKWLAYEVRAACTFLGQVLATEIAQHEARQESAYTTRSTALLAKFLDLMVTASHPLIGLINSSPNLLDLVPSTGAAVVIGDKVQTLGITPGYLDLLSLIRALRGVDAPSTFATKSLRYHFPALVSIADTSSGIIALEISREPESYVVLFRPEIAETVTWAGDPNKPATVEEEGYRLSPRKSFAAWKEVTQGVALPWTKQEIRVADELRKLIAIIIAKGNSSQA
jgi:light-regulated signal transduction histidine kinase (bacteriophytochrome)